MSIQNDGKLGHGMTARAETGLLALSNMEFVKRIMNCYLGATEYDELKSPIIMLLPNRENTSLQQIKNMAEQLQEGLTEEREKNVGKWEMEKLEGQIRQQEAQLKELESMYYELYGQCEEEKEDQPQSEKYTMVLDNSLKLEKMRYGVF